MTRPLSMVEALTWLRDVATTDERLPPTKLHSLDTVTQGELGAPAMTTAFVRHLVAQHWDKTDAVVSVKCPNHRDDEWRINLSCPTCGGNGFYEVVRSRWRYPFWHSRELLKLKLSIRPGQPSPSQIVDLVIAMEYDVRMAWLITDIAIPVSWDAYEALTLMAIRDLHRRFSLGPTPRRWTELSESQQQAIVSGEQMEATA